jgi:amidase
MLNLDTATVSTALTSMANDELTSEELLDAHLERIERHNPTLNAVVALDVDRARARARAADDARRHGESWGPLHGLPMTIKDSFETEGLVTTSGAPELAQHVPAKDAAGVRALKSAGAIVFGKTNLPLYAGDFQSYNEVYGLTRNPWDPERTAGGSSGGAAVALATGMTLLELGSDIGGSIRNPAHYNGVFGHKASWGAIDIVGHVPGPPGSLATPDLGVAGPLARSIADLILALDVLTAGGVNGVPGARLPAAHARATSARSLNVAVFTNDETAPTSAECRDAVHHAAAALDAAGAHVEEVRLPGPSLAEQQALYIELLLPALEQNLALTHADWLRADEQRHHLIADYETFFDDYDVLLMPIAPTTAFTHRTDGSMLDRTLEVDGVTVPYVDHIVWAGPAILSYLPATAVPVRRSAEGLPIGMQIVGRRWADKTTLAVGGLVETLLGGFVAPP